MKRIIIISGLVTVLIISSFFIKLPYIINCSGKILPAREWIVKNDNGGDIVSIFNNQNNNSTYTYIDYKFERGDIANFNLSENYIDNVNVKKGDTIGYISSYLFEERLQQLKSSLNEENAYLSVIKTGDKKSLIESSKNQYLITKQEHDLQLKNYERQKALYDKKLIAASEFEIAARNFELAKTNVELAKNNLTTVETGEKSELIQYEMEKIKSIEHEIQILDYKQNKYSFIAPFDGKIVTKKMQLNSPEIETYHIFHVIDTTEYIVLLPVELFQRKYINRNIIVNTFISDDSQTITGKYSGENQNVEITGGYKQVYIVRGSLASNGKNIPYGIYANCSINCGTVSLFEYIKRKIRV